jgi:hypothetical protein
VVCLLDELRTQEIWRLAERRRGDDIQADRDQNDRVESQAHRQQDRNGAINSNDTAILSAPGRGIYERKIGNCCMFFFSPP